VSGTELETERLFWQWLEFCYQLLLHARAAVTARICKHAIENHKSFTFSSGETIEVLQFS